MRAILFLTLGLMLVIAGCVDCEPPIPEPTIIERTVTDTVIISGEVNSQPNNITGACLLACTEGLATGTYYTLYDKMIEVWLRGSFGPTWYETLTWVGPLNITKTGGNGVCDSVRFTTAYQTLDGSNMVWGYLKRATLGKSTGEIIAQEIYPNAGGMGGLDTAVGGDQCQLIWEIEASIIPSAASYGLTDTFNFLICQGIGYNTSSPILYIDFIYKNGDTNRVSVDYSFSHANDTSWARVMFFCQDTLRAADTCITRWLVTQSNKRTGWDTADVVIPANSALKQYFQGQLTRL